MDYNYYLELCKFINTLQLGMKVYWSLTSQIFCFAIMRNVIKSFLNKAKTLSPAKSSAKIS